MCFFCYDLDLDPKTLIYEYDLDILKTYLHTRSELSVLRLSKVTALTYRCDHTQYHTAFNVVKTKNQAKAAPSVVKCIHFQPSRRQFVTDIRNVSAASNVKLRRR